jgi:putative inorganic carbon (HCO3(-)) transporter
VCGVGFLILTVPLIPYRYLLLPTFMPVGLQQAFQYAPAGAGLLVGAVWYLWRRGIAATVPALPLGLPVLVLLLTGIAGSLGSSQPLLSTAKTLYYFATGGLLYLVLVDVLSGERRSQARVLLYLLLVTAYVASLYGILEFLLGQNPLYAQSFTPENELYRRLTPDPWFGHRIRGTIGHPVLLGTYLGLIFPLSISVALGAESRAYRAVFLTGSLAVLVALVLTFTRGAWLSCLVAMGVYLKLHSTRRLLLMPLGLVLLAVVVLGFASTTRGAAYGYAGAIANEHPAMGLGTGMYRFAAYELRRTLDIATPLGVLDTPHNMYLSWLVERGIIGLCAAVYVLAAIFRRLLRACKEQPEQRELIWGFVAAFAGLCVNMLTVDSLTFHVTRTVFWIMAGLAVALCVPARSEADEHGAD